MLGNVLTGRPRARSVGLAVGFVACLGLQSGCAAWHVKQDWPNMPMDTDKSSDIQARTNAIKANLTAMMGQPVTDIVTPFAGDPKPAGTPEAAAQQTASNLIANAMLSNGFGYVDDKCTVLFGELLKIQRDTHFWTTQAALLGTAAGAIIAIAGPGVQAAGIAAAATAAAVGTSENIGSDLLFDLDAGTTFNLNNKYRAAFRDKALGDVSAIRNYSSAYSYISAYASLCTPVAIEAQVKEQLAKAVPADQNPALAKAPDTDIDTSLTALASQTGLDKGISRDDAKVLYVIFSKDFGTASAADQAKLLSGVHARLAQSNADLDKEVFDATGSTSATATTPKLRLTAATQQQLTDGLAALATFYPALEPDAATIRTGILQPGAAQAPAPAAIRPVLAPVVVAPPVTTLPVTPLPGLPPPVIRAPVPTAPDAVMRLPNIH